MVCQFKFYAIVLEKKINILFFLHLTIQQYSMTQILFAIFLLTLLLETRTTLALICYRCKSSDPSLGGACNYTLGSPVPTLIKACFSNSTCVTFQNPYDNNGSYVDAFSSIHNVVYFKMCLFTFIQLFGGTVVKMFGSQQQPITQEITILVFKIRILKVYFATA